MEHAILSDQRFYRHVFRAVSPGATQRCQFCFAAFEGFVRARHALDRPRSLAAERALLRAMRGLSPQALGRRRGPIRDGGHARVK